jgi:hypothetical protein
VFLFSLKKSLPGKRTSKFEKMPGCFEMEKEFYLQRNFFVLWKFLVNVPLYKTQNLKVLHLILQGVLYKVSKFVSSS